MTLCERTALLVVDAQRMFCDPGFAGGSGNDATDAACRRASVLADYFRTAGRRPYLVHAAQGCAAGRTAYGVTPAGNDIVITKRAKSAFDGTTLDALLRAGKHHRLVVAGVHASFCVHATVRDALHAGYDVTLLRDATADGMLGSRISHDYALWDLARRGARIAASQTVFPR